MTSAPFFSASNSASPAMSRTSYVGVPPGKGVSPWRFTHAFGMPRAFAGTMSWKLLCAACSQRASPMRSRAARKCAWPGLYERTCCAVTIEVEVDGEVAARRGEEIVVDVREDAEPVAGVAQSLQRGVRVGERLPRRQRLGEERGALGGERPSEGLRRRGCGLGEDVAVGAVVLALDHRLDLRVGAQDLVAAQRRRRPRARRAGTRRRCRSPSR